MSCVTSVFGVKHGTGSWDEVSSGFSGWWLFSGDWCVFQPLGGSQVVLGVLQWQVETVHQVVDPGHVLVRP